MPDEDALPEEIKEMLEKFKALGGKKCPWKLKEWSWITTGEFTCPMHTPATTNLGLKMSRYNPSCRPNAVVSILFGFIKVNLISELLLTQKLV